MEDRETSAMRAVGEVILCGFALVGIWRTIEVVGLLLQSLEVSWSWSP